MPDMTLTLDTLDNVRALYDLSFMPGFDAPRLWRIEKYLIDRLERVGLAAPPDLWNDHGPVPGSEIDHGDHFDYLAVLQPDLGGSD